MCAERKNCSVIIRIQFVIMQEDEGEQPSSFHNSEASNGFSVEGIGCQCPQGSDLQVGEVSKGEK